MSVFRRAVVSVLRACLNFVERPQNKGAAKVTTGAFVAVLMCIATAMMITSGAVIALNMLDKAPSPRAFQPQPTPDELDQEKWPCDPRSEIRTSDLCAQWKAADAARDAANWTAISFIIGTLINVATLVFVAFNFVEARKAAVSAQLSAEASIRSADSAALETSMQTRAWLALAVRVIGTIEQRPSRKGKTELAGKLAVDVTNVGSIPAIDVRCYVKFGLWQFGVTDEETRDKFRAECIRSYSSTKHNRIIGRVSAGEAVFPGRSSVIMETFKKDFAEVISLTSDGGFVPVIYGCVIYRIHGQLKPRYTSFIYDLIEAGDGDYTEEIVSGHWTDRALLVRPTGLIDAV